MDRIGEYLVKRLVGEGGMGKVYEAEERLSGRRVALKVLRPELTRHEDGRRLFLNEMQILAHLEHPGLVRSLASLEIDGQLVLVLEYLHGRTLRDELAARGALPWAEAVEHVVRIAEALSVAHEQEPAIVHRDLKPENVMLVVPDGAAAALAAPTSLKVMDFGVAKVLEGASGPSTQSIGTLQYMSPEQIDAGVIDGRSDLYALGLVLYEMLAGDPPFRSPSPRELLNLQCTTAPAPLAEDVRRGLPRGVEELLFSLLEKAPADRPSSARDVVAALAPFRAAAAPATARTGGLASRPGRAARHEAVTSHGGPSSPPRASVVEERPEARSPGAGGTLHSGATPPAPRLDTAQLVLAGSVAAPRTRREVPTWLALVAIVVLSAAAGLGTYVARLRASGIGEPRPTSTVASAASEVGIGDARKR